MNKKLRQLEEARARIREAGLRATPARIAVLNLLAERRGPVSHQEAIDALESHGVDKSTIFRSLQDLAQAGLLRRMELGDHVWRFEWLDVGDRTSQRERGHPHLLCVDCGNITCLAQSDIKLNVSKTIGTVADILLRGTCADCLGSR